MTTKIKKIFFAIIGVFSVAFMRLLWYWNKSGLIGKSLTAILSLVFLVFALASFYVVAPENITRAADVDIDVSAGSDDGFCYESGSCYLTSGNIRLGYRDGYGNCHAGFRFLNIVIPQGATIDSAYFTYFAYDDSSLSTSVKIWAEASDDGATFATSGGNSPEGKTAGAVSVAWTLPNQVAASSYTSPDIKTVIQEVVNRVGWSSGNALVILVRNNSSSNNRNASSYEWKDPDGVESASISIDYTVSGGGSTRRIIIVE